MLPTPGPALPSSVSAASSQADLHPVSWESQSSCKWWSLACRNKGRSWGETGMRSGWLFQTAYASCMGRGQFLFEQILQGQQSFLPSFLLLTGTRASAPNSISPPPSCVLCTPVHTQTSGEQSSAILGWKTAAAASRQVCHQFLSAREVQFTSSVPGYTNSATRDIPGLTQQLPANCIDLHWYN